VTTKESVEGHANPRRTFMANVRFTFVTGILLSVPFLFTLWLLKLVIFPLDNFLQPIFHRLFQRNLPGLGFLAILVFIFVVGLVGRNVPGRMFFGLLERVFLQIPVARNIYNATKELLAAFSFQNKKGTFREVCLVEYPRAGVWSMGFVTNRVTLVGTEKKRGEEMITVYIPSPPNPATGNFILVPVDHVFPVDMSVEEGLKMALSGGIVSPDTLRMKGTPA
jgi:uncharacterized membrane protein